MPIITPAISASVTQVCALLAHSARTPAWRRETTVLTLKQANAFLPFGTGIFGREMRQMVMMVVCDGEKEDSEDNEEEDAAGRRWDCCGALEGVEACDMTVRPIRLPKKITTDVSLAS
jgi:hypothetical protein